MATPGFAFALETHYPSIFGLSVNDTSTFPEYARYFFNLGVVAAGFIAVLVILAGGVYWLISFGRGKFTDEGKEWVKSGALGLLIVLSSYLIAYTINPDLVIFKLSNLPGIGGGGNNTSPIPPGVTIETYMELPIGTLTETLLTRKVECYDFDVNGDPILGEDLELDDGTTIKGPTYLEIDRLECIIKTASAVEKKMSDVKKIADAMIEQMSKCQCSEADKKCDHNCDDNGCDPYSGSCPVEEGSDTTFLCTGNCKYNPYTPGPSRTDSCKMAEDADPESCCPEDVWKKIRGEEPTKISEDAYECAKPEKDYYGLPSIISPPPDNGQCDKNPIIRAYRDYCPTKHPYEYHKKPIWVIDKTVWMNATLYKQIGALQSILEGYYTEISSDTMILNLSLIHI